VFAFTVNDNAPRFNYHMNNLRFLLAIFMPTAKETGEIRI